MCKNSGSTSSGLPSSSASPNSSASSSNGANTQCGGKSVKQQFMQLPDGEDISAFRKALTPGNYVEWHKDEALDVFWWLKQVVAVVLGVTFGIFRVTGWAGFVLFGVIQFLAANAWAERAQVMGVFFEHFDVFTENTLVALGTFLVCWMLSFTLTAIYLGA